MARVTRRIPPRTASSRPSTPTPCATGWASVDRRNWQTAFIILPHPVLQYDLLLLRLQQIITERITVARPNIWNTSRRSVDLQVACLDGPREVLQLHLGGGTPTFLSHDELRQLMGIVKKHFTLVPDGEYSIEVDPRKVDEATVALLGELGFNRMSVGIQDFNPDVQKAVNRVQSEDETRW